MAAIQIPDRLADLLNRHNPLAASVHASISRLNSWLATPLPFFPEYTDHGPAHISSVPSAAVALIREAAFPSLTPEDAALAASQFPPLDVSS